MLSTRPEKYVGTVENWDRATNALMKALDKKHLNYTIDPGEGVFYGPKVDIKIKDSLGRSWQCSTVQVDFNIPERFRMTYIDKNNQTVLINLASSYQNIGRFEDARNLLIEITRHQY